MPTISKKSVINLTIVGSFAALALAGCEAMQSGAPPVTPAMTRGATGGGESEQSLVAGRKVLATRCISCHGLEPIGNYTPEQWQVNVRAMADRAGLNVEEERQLTAYLVAARESLR